MKTRAKFVVQSRTESKDGYTVLLSAVTSTSPENSSFFKYTPSGTINMGLVQPETAEHFKPGTELYVDFTVVEKPEQLHEADK